MRVDVLSQAQLDVARRTIPRGFLGVLQHGTQQDAYRHTYDRQ